MAGLHDGDSVYHTIAFGFFSRLCTKQGKSFSKAIEIYNKRLSDRVFGLNLAQIPHAAISTNMSLAKSACGLDVHLGGICTIRMGQGKGWEARRMPAHRPGSETLWSYKPKEVADWLFQAGKTRYAKDEL